MNISYLLETENTRCDKVPHDVLLKSAVKWYLIGEQIYRPFSYYLISHGKYTSPQETISNFVHVAVQLECYPKDSEQAITFIVNEVLKPMSIYEPDLIKNKFSVSAKYIGDGDYTNAVIYFALFAANSSRHYIYPNRPTYKAPSLLEAWLRRQDQGKPMWRFLRCLFLGASNVASLVGANEQWEFRTPPAKRKTPQRILTDCLGITTPEPFTETILDACKHGTLNEDLGRTVYCNLTGYTVYEIGTAMSPNNSCYTQSPDGLVVADNFINIGNNDKLYDLTYDAEKHRFVRAGLQGLIEIKCQKIKQSCYDKCPDLYIPQTIQGMIVHGVDWCDFVSIYYVPERHDPDEISFTIERIFYNEDVAKWLQSCFDEFSKSMSEGKQELHQKFYQEFEKRKLDDKKHMFQKLDRAYVLIENNGLRVPAKCIKMNLAKAVGSKELANYWKKKNNVV